jgi:hypothetical protein
MNQREYEGSGHCIIYDSILAFAYKDWVKPLKPLSEDS